LTKGQCAKIHEAFIKDIYETCSRSKRDIILFYTPDDGVEILKNIMPDQEKFIPQVSGDLGKKMGTAIQESLAMGYDSCVLMGTDVPTLKLEDIEEAFEVLKTKEVYLKPTFDGGYFIIGMKRANFEVFDIEGYGHEKVIENTLENLNRLNLSYGISSCCLDIDEPEDLEKLCEGIKSGEYRCKNTTEYLVEIGRVESAG
jgi:rSAM/selenodomain-associated transferase 1